MVTIQTIEEVIEKLGGTKAVAELTKRPSPSAVPNWIVRNSFPLNTYTILKAALRARGYDAPDELWKMPEVAQ